MTDQIIASINAFAAVVQAIFVIVSLIYINRQFAIVRACSYIERFNCQESICRRSKVDHWLKSNDDDSKRIEVFEEDPDLRCDILGFINLFQELGVAYLRHSVHKQTVRENFDFLVPHYWGQCKFLIEYLRTKRENPTMYRKFEFMAEQLSNTVE